jgi:hypothetical protein
MGRTFDKSVLAGVGLVVALLVANAGLAYWNTRQLFNDAGMVARIGCCTSLRAAWGSG